MIALLWWESPSSKCAELHIVTASNNRDHPMRSLYYCLFTPHAYGFYSSCTFRSWWIAHSTQCQPRGCNNISLSQRTTLIAHSFCEGCIWHDLHILGTAPSKTLGDKCTKFHTVAACNNRDHLTRSLCYRLFVYEYMGVILHAHPFCGELYIQRNVNREVVTVHLDQFMIFVTWPNTKPKPKPKT